ncbi:hypothetical protein [Marinomonas fungiae]|uniref:Uncharacterized protein n=1 Tax=Marinomonas fungiae TaxID=1137284 RepID=A0A0K6II50_9GAMM|nr:hypothetical protein [Marinomonas fungiae]CUB03012.1 hypothetical protein Ga0061065_102351 [Marinomonas fungiae]
MPEVSIASAPSIVSVLFDLETAIFTSHVYPLKSHLAIQSGLHVLQAEFNFQDSLQHLLKDLIDSLDQVIEAGNFLSASQLADLVAWVSGFRSVWIAQQDFEDVLDCSVLQTLQQRLLNSLSTIMRVEVNRFMGEFSGRVPHGFEDFSTLSDVGYWVIRHAENSLPGASSQSNTVVIRVVLETGLSLMGVTERLPNWQWQLAPCEEDHALSLAPESENYWVDWLHTMASEREVWRRSPSFMGFYKSLQEQVREQFSVALNQLYELPNAANVWVIPAAEQVSEATQFDLYGGRVYLLDQLGQACQVLTLSESVIPVYLLECGTHSFAIPAYRAQLLRQDEQTTGQVWTYTKGGLFEQQDALVGQQLVRVATQQGGLCLGADRVTRDYGVLLRSGCLPRSTRNVWRIRNSFQLEPVLPNELLQAAERQWSVSYSALARPKNHTPVYFQFTEHHGVELFADMIIGLQPYRSIERVMSGFIYFNGQVMPLIEPEMRHCHPDDMVMIVMVRGAYFAFRGRYSLEKETLHKLVDGDVIMLSWQDDRINISLRDKGWFLLDQRHTYLFHKQLLEILK